MSTAEKPIFQAQCLANIGRFAHPHQFEQPRVKGELFTIELLEGEELTPVTCRYQTFNKIQARFLTLKCDHMMAEQRMERSTSPWKSRISLVAAQDKIDAFVARHEGNSTDALYDPANMAEILTFYRLTLDLRGVNMKTKAFKYPLPNIPDILAACAGCDRFSIGDIQDAFYTVEMEPKSREYCAFSTPDGHFQLTVMPQGAKNAAVFWACMIARKFRPMTERNAPLIIYQDDIGNRALQLLAHIMNQQEMYNIMEIYDIIFKMIKTHINYMTQRILGHVVSRQGRTPDSSTVEAITALQRPRTLRDAQSIVGLFQYAREYIPCMATIMEPIQALCRKGVDINRVWKQDPHGVAFETLKLAITSQPVLKIPDINQPFIVQVDACRIGKGIGAILLQKDITDQTRPCAYYSRSLTSQERHYSATELECSSLHDSILHWKVFLQNGRHFQVVADHFALIYMVTRSGSEQQNQRLLRLCLDLQGFSFSVTHISGVRHLAADAVSRLLRTNDIPYINTVDELRDDWGPLPPEKVASYHRTYGPEAQFIIDTINTDRSTKFAEYAALSANIQRELEQNLLANPPAPTWEVPIINDWPDTSSSVDSLSTQGGQEAEHSELAQSNPPEDDWNHCDHCTLQLPASNIFIHTMHQEYSPPISEVLCHTCALTQPAELEEDAVKHSIIKWNHIGKEQPHHTQSVRLSEEVDRLLHWQKGHERAARRDIINIRRQIQHAVNITNRRYWIQHGRDVPSMHAEALAIVARLPEPVQTLMYEHYREIYGPPTGEEPITPPSPNPSEEDSTERDEDLSFMEAPAVAMPPITIQFNHNRPICRHLPQFTWTALRAMVTNPLTHSKLRAEILAELSNREQRPIPIEGMATSRLRHRLSQLEQFEDEESQQQGERIWQELDKRADRKLVARALSTLDANTTEPRYQAQEAAILLQDDQFLQQQQQNEHELMEQHLGNTGIIIHALTLEKPRRTPSQERAQQLVEQTQREIRLRSQRRIGAINLQLIKNRHQRATATYDQTTKALNELKAAKRLRRTRQQLEPEFAEEETEWALNKELAERGDHLIMQFYTDPHTGEMHQITDVILDTDHRTHTRIIKSVAHLYDDETGLDFDTPPQVLPIYGTQGTSELVAQFLQGKRSHTDTPIPNSWESWRALQDQDPYCAQIIEAMGPTHNSIFPLDNEQAWASEEYLFYAQGDPANPILRRSTRHMEYRNTDTTCDIKQEVIQMVVPHALAEKVIWQMHDAFGHPGRNRTTNTIRLRYHWPGMHKDIQTYCNRCRYCHLRKANNRVAKVPIQIYNYAERMGSRVHLDLAGPFQISGEKYAHIMVLKDALTKFIVLIALVSKDMVYVQSKLISHWVAIFGPPEMLITDGGKEFKNTIAKQLARLWDCRKVNTTPRNPRSDGQAENQMRTLKDMLQAFTQSHPEDWHLHLATVAMAYNGLVNDATGFTPYYLTFGKEMTTASQHHTEALDVNEFHELVKQEKEVQQWFWQYTAHRVVNNSERHNRVPAERLEYKAYERGDFFYLRTIPLRTYRTDKEANKRMLSAKLQYRYCGPYVIKAVLSPVTFRASIHGVPTVVHALNMKRISGIHQRSVVKRNTTLGTQTESNHNTFGTQTQEIDEPDTQQG